MKLLPSIYWLVPLLLYTSTSPLVFADDELECTNSNTNTPSKGSTCFSSANVAVDCKKDDVLAMTFKSLPDKRSTTCLISDPGEGVEIHVECFCSVSNCNNEAKFKEQLVEFTKQNLNRNEKYFQTAVLCITGETAEDIRNPTTTSIIETSTLNTTSSQSKSSLSNEELYLYLAIGGWSLAVILAVVAVALIIYTLMKRGAAAAPAKDDKNIASSNTPRATTTATAPSSGAQTPKSKKTTEDTIDLTPPPPGQEKKPVVIKSLLKPVILKTTKGKEISPPMINHDEVYTESSRMIPSGMSNEKLTIITKKGGVN